MLTRIFDLETGRIYEQDVLDANSASVVIGAVRQICLLFKKLELPCTAKRQRSAINNFVQIEDDFKTLSISEEDIKSFDLVSSCLWDNIMHRIHVQDIVPRHGPGATADRISGNRKFVHREWTERLEPYFPASSSCNIVTEESERELQRLTFLSPEEERPVKVVLVPKTLKSPRVIAEEPLCMQYAQQGIRSAIYRLLESDDDFSGRINFRDQSINQSLAMAGSLDGQLVTIDLSDASDRVPRDLALRMFRSNRDLHDSIDACRSTHASLPDGRRIGPLGKFASMGSALCFPVEAMYFYTICVVACLQKDGLPVTFQNVKSTFGKIHVYGDDIVVPLTYAESVLEHLQKYNCKVNHNKTFVTGRFRESCGADYWYGELVTPIYCSSDVPQNRQQANEIVSWCAMAQLMFNAGLWASATFAFARIEKIMGTLPYVSRTSQALGRHTFQDSLIRRRWNKKLVRHRWNKDLQAYEMKVWMPESVYRTDRLSDGAALYKSLSKLTDLKDLWDIRDRHHLERSALRGVVALQLRWVPVT
jgi:hypothetical protein